jgi:hypothetical protein
MPSNVIGHERRDGIIAVGRSSFSTNPSESPISIEKAVLALAKVD